jgi:hypothetical protein
MAALLGRLTGTSKVDFAKLEESLERKKSLAEVKRKLCLGR